MHVFCHIQALNLAKNGLNNLFLLLCPIIALPNKLPPKGKLGNWVMVVEVDTIQGGSLKERVHHFLMPVYQVPT